MADEPPFKVNRSTLPPSVKTLFNPKNCFVKGGLVFDDKERPVLAGNCQVVQFGKVQFGKNKGNDCMFVCQADFSKGSQEEEERPVLASFVFNDMGRVIDLYFGNGAAAPSTTTHVKDGTRASFGILPPPPPPKLLHRPHSLIMLATRMKEIREHLKQNHKSMTEQQARELNDEKNKLAQKQFKEEEQAKKAAEEEHARALDEYAKNPWGCTRVLKGPLTFVGCQLDTGWGHYGSFVEGFPYVSCIQVHADFDERLEMSHDNEKKVKPYFEYAPHAGSRYGSSASQYYEGGGFDNFGGNLGHESFVVLQDERIHTMETRQGSCPRPRPVPPTLSALNPDTKKKYEVELRKGHRSLLLEMRALEWIGMNPLIFPTTESIDLNFANTAFRWVHDLSKQFKEPGLSFSPAVLTEMLAKRASPAMLAPSMRGSLFHSLVQQPVTAATKNITECSCIPTNHDPRCPNQFCQYRHAAPEYLSFMWPRIQFESVNPRARSALNAEILVVAAREQEQAAKEAAKAAAAEATAAAKLKAVEERKAAAEAKAAEKAAAKQQEQAAKAAAKASAVASAPLRGKRSAAPAFAEIVASSAPISMASAAPVASSASAAPAEPARQSRGRSAAPVVSAASAKRASTPPSRKKKKGGSKSKSKRRDRR